METALKTTLGLLEPWTTGLLGMAGDSLAPAYKMLLAGGNVAAHKLTGRLPTDLPENRDLPLTSDWFAAKTGAPVGDPTFEKARTVSALTGLLSAAGPQINKAAAPLLAEVSRAMGPLHTPQGNLSPLTVWQGSPHHYPAEPGFPAGRIRLDKIGTGEGAQAYGHGAYLAEAPSVAKTYADMDPVTLASPCRAFRGVELEPGSPQYHAATLLESRSLPQVRKEVAQWIASAKPGMEKEVAGWQATLDTLNSATSKKDFKQIKGGFLRQFDLPDFVIPRLLDWDKPLSQQAPEVQKAVTDAMLKRGITKSVADYIVANKTGNEALATISRGAYDARLNVPDGPQAAAASQMLQSAGIPGIRYLDGGSRGAGQGTRNFVIWDQGLLDSMPPLEINGVPTGLLK